MTQVNLLPVEVNERLKSRRITTVIAAGAGAALILLGFVFMVQSSRLSSVKHQLAAQQAENSHLQSQVTGLQHYSDLKQQVADKEALVTSITKDEVQWSGVLRDLSMVIPGDVWLTQFQASVANSQTTASTATTTTTTPGSSIIGNLQFQGGALSHHHGVGLNRSRFVREALGPSFDVLVAMKQALDPNGILNPGKLGLPDPFGAVKWP